MYRACLPVQILLLLRSGASAMFQASIPEIMQKTTGHRSIEALQSYRQVSTEQQKAVSRVLMTNGSCEFQKMLEACKLLVVFLSIPASAHISLTITESFFPLTGTFSYTKANSDHLE